MNKVTWFLTFGNNPQKKRISKKAVTKKSGIFHPINWNKMVCDLSKWLPENFSFSYLLSFFFFGTQYSENNEFQKWKWGYLKKLDKKMINKIDCPQTKLYMFFSFVSLKKQQLAMPFYSWIRVIEQNALKILIKAAVC